MNSRSLWPHRFLLPALFSLSLLSTLFYNGSHYHWLAVGWILLFGLGYLCWLRPDETTPPPLGGLLFISLLLLTLWIVTSQAWSPLPRTTAITGWRLATLGTLFLTFVLWGGERLWRALLVALFLVGCGVALYSSYQGLFTTEQATGSFINRNINAGFLNLILWPAAALLLYSATDRGRWPIYALVVYLAALAILQTSSRGAIGSALLVLPLLLVLSWREASHRARLTLLTLMAAALLTEWLLPGSSGIERMGTLAAPVEAASPRLLLWSSALAMIGEAPWHGIGAGMFAWLYPPFREPSERSLGVFVHNDYLQLWLELGWPALLLILLTAIGLLLTLRRIYRGDSPHRLEAFGLFTGIIAVLIHSMVTYNLYIVPTLMVIGLYLGRLYRLAYVTTTTMTDPIGRRIPLALVVALLLLLPLQHLASSGYAYMLGHGYLGSSGRPPELRVADLQRAMRLDPTSDAYPLLLANLYRGLIPLNEPNNQRLLFDEAERLYALARDINPYRPDALWQYGQLLFTQPELAGHDAPGRAETWVERALVINPRTFQARLLNARLLDQRGATEQALTLLIEGLRQPLPIDSTVDHYFRYGEQIAERLDRPDARQLFQTNRQRFAERLERIR